MLDQRGVIKPPAHLSLEEASTLPCAALTAWHALMKPVPVTPGDVVLILGTGGVSVFARQFCQLLGVRMIVTSSSDEKLARMAALGTPGATDRINYRTTPDWEQAVLELTGGAGADRVIEVDGPGTLQRSITAIRVGGTIAFIGILTGATGAVVLTDLMRKSIDLHGIYAGSREMFAQMNKAIALYELRR